MSAIPSSLYYFLFGEVKGAEGMERVAGDIGTKKGTPPQHLISALSGKRFLGPGWRQRSPSEMAAGQFAAYSDQRRRAPQRDQQHHQASKRGGAGAAGGWLGAGRDWSELQREPLDHFAARAHARRRRALQQRPVSESVLF
jgi:hypothetical protein